MTTDARRARRARRADWHKEAVDLINAVDEQESGHDKIAMLRSALESAESRGIVKGRAEAFEEAAKSMRGYAKRYKATSREPELTEAIEMFIRWQCEQFDALAQADAKKGDGGL